MLYFVRIKDVPCYTRRGQVTCQHDDKLTLIWIERVRPVIVQTLDNALNVSFIPGDVQVWVTDVTHSASQHVSELHPVHTAVLRGEVIFLHSTPFQAKALCASCCLCISVDCCLDGLVHRDAVEWILTTSWTLKPPCTKC